MADLQSKLDEVNNRLSQNVGRVEQIRKEIKNLQEEGEGLTQPILEDTGAKKILESIINEV
tara:strand:- start:1720 stop:1902 length:183 start_codon:yes stop_codon:yes gene_type:complete